MLANSKIEEEILEYLFEHPEASDTLEGIAEWWLLRQRIEYEMKRVKAAISNLVQQGWMIEIKGKNSKARYRLNPEKTQRK